MPFWEPPKKNLNSLLYKYNVIQRQIKLPRNVTYKGMFNTKLSFLFLDLPVMEEFVFNYEK